MVITIIVLLILATVAISMAIDSNGLFKRAEYAAETWNDSVRKESTAIENAMLIMNEMYSGNTSGGGITPPPSGGPTLPEGWDKEKVADVVEEGERKAPIPKGYTASQIPGEDKISDGLVIYEGADPVTGEKDGTEHQAALAGRNQYVWIPVADINDMVMCQQHPNDKLDKETALCTTCKENTPLAGKLYTNIHKTTEDSTTPQLTYNANFGSREPAVVTGTGAQYDGAINESFGLGTAEVFLAHLQEEFSNMAKSVAKYKGFYISRYEIQAGAASKKGAGVLNAGSSSANMWYGLYTTIQNSNSGSSKSTVAQMIWGSQYDQVMMFALEKARTDGTGAAFDVKTASDTRKRSSGQVSGNNPADLVCNIYDLENNYYEWTAEANGASVRVRRGRRVRRQRFRIEPLG